MSIPVDLENLEDALSEYGMNPYLIIGDFKFDLDLQLSKTKQN